MTSSRQAPNIKSQTISYVPLEERTLRFARDARTFVRAIPRGIITIEDGKQLVRSSGSVGANYIEANEALSKRDFQLRIKICRKEAKESRYWLQLFDDIPEHSIANRDRLIQEATELLKIFSSMLL